MENPCVVIARRTGHPDDRHVGSHQKIAAIDDDPEGEARLATV